MPPHLQHLADALLHPSLADGRGLLCGGNRAAQQELHHAGLAVRHRVWRVGGWDAGSPVLPAVPRRVPALRQRHAHRAGLGPGRLGGALRDVPDHLESGRGHRARIVA